jgi:type IV pilus assembly protein PilQ
MKKYLSRIIPVFIVLCILLYNPGISPSIENADQIKTPDKKTETAAVQVGYLENVLFGKLPGKERINLIVSQQPVINVSALADGSLVVKLENMFVPDNLRGSLGEGELVNMFRVQPQQQLVDGKQFIYLTIELKKSVPYAIRQEGKNIFIDFNIASLKDMKPVASTVAKGKSKKAEVKKEDEEKRSEDIASVSEDVQENDEKAVKKIIPLRNADRLITLDFQDADIKTVLRLMAEYGNTSIISGEDVKGKVTLTIKNTPWEQALDSILDTQGLAKKQMGDVITVMTLERKKKDEDDRSKAEIAQVVAEETRQARELKKMAEKGKLRQILIEAKIVEASETFIRDLGVQWGFLNHSTTGSYGLGVSGGSNPISSTNSKTFNYPPEVYTPIAGTPLSMAAVNFPTAAVTAAGKASPVLGLVFGGAQGFIETQLSALEANGMGKVISSPKVVTMDGVPAVIKQGEEVPYVTPASGTTSATVTFKEAVLKLEVTPQITEEGKVSMKIKASNDRPDYARGQTLPLGNPPIWRTEVDSKVVVQDGDTLVIGGVSRITEDETTTGIPWFYKIPVLGWLFKTENISKSKLQLLIFITPKIIGGVELSGAVEKTKK